MADERENDPVEEMAHVMGEPYDVSGEPPPIQVIRRLDKALGIAEQVVVAVCLVGLIGIASYKGIMAQFFEEDPPWAKPLIWHFLFLVAMASAVLSIQTNQIIKMDFVTRKVGRKTRTGLRIATYLFAIFVLVILAWGAWDARLSVADTDKFLDDRLVAVSLPIACAAICLHLLLHATIDFLYLARGEAPPELQEPSGH